MFEAARGWQAAWDRAGPVGLLEWVLSKDDTRARLLSRTDGERRLTNWLHLAELLQQNWQKGRPGPGALAVYLGTLRKDSRSRRELTDDDALMTKLFVSMRRKDAVSGKKVMISPRGMYSRTM